MLRVGSDCSVVLLWLLQKSASRSRTPTPRIESTSQELGNSPSALGARAAAVSPAASDGQCVKYDTSGLSDTAAAAGNSDGIFAVQNDGVFASGSVDLSEALSSWPDLKVNMATETATVSNGDRMSPVQNDGVLPSEAARLSGWPDLKENGDNLTFSGNQTGRLAVLRGDFVNTVLYLLGMST